MECVVADKTLKDCFLEAFLFALDEAFENVHGMFLDRGTSLFETLATISAEEASRPVSPACASLAAHVEHMRFYLDLTVDYVQGRRPEKVDWGEIWRTVRAVTPEEWEASKNRLHDSYQKIIELAKSMETWEGEGEIGGALAVLAHTAYHLGEIRQALCTIKT